MMTGLVFDRLCAKVRKLKCRLELREDKEYKTNQKNASTPETAVFLIISFANNLCSLSLEVLLVALSICGAFRPWFNRWLWQGQWNADCRHLWIYTIATAAMVLKCFEFVWEPGSIQCHSWRFGVSVCLILRLLTHLLAALFQMVFVQGGTLVPLEPRTGAKTCQADRLPMHRMCTVAKTWQN